MQSKVDCRFEAGLLLNRYGVDAFSVTVQKADESKLNGDAALERHWRRVGLAILDVALLNRSDIYVIPRRVWPKQRCPARKWRRKRTNHQARRFVFTPDGSNQGSSSLNPTISHGRWIA
jgi:hypothetical protein